MPCFIGYFVFKFVNFYFKNFVESLRGVGLTLPEVSDRLGVSRISSYHNTLEKEDALAAYEQDIADSIKQQIMYLLNLSSTFA